MQRAMLCSLAVLVGASVSPAQNLLVNPGFESGLDGWFVFGNAYAESSNPPQFVPYEGDGLVSMFGNFSGSFNVTGIFQEFPALPGQSWTMDAYTRHWSGDPMVGSGAPDDNWAVMKIAFKDAGDIEIGSAERTILDGTFATDVWHDHEPISGLAPAGTVQVEAFILYLQPVFDGGAAHVDNVFLVPAPVSGALLGLAALLAARRSRA